MIQILLGRVLFRSVLFVSDGVTDWIQPSPHPPPPNLVTSNCLRRRARLTPDPQPFPPVPMTPSLVMRFTSRTSTCCGLT